MASPVIAAMPQLFEGVRFNWDISDSGIVIEYVGTGERLLECGAIEPGMAEKRAVRSPKPRFDSAGHPFRREVRGWSPEMTPRLLIKRWISDPKFAGTLPGVPPGLRFKRLDWLDSHPGEVHHCVRNYDDSRYRHTLTAGRAGDLIRAGFPPGLFSQKLCPFDSASIRRREFPEFVLDEDAYAIIRCLMRGYFEIEIADRIKAAGAARPTVAAVPPRVHLRLVVDNVAVQS